MREARSSVRAPVVILAAVAGGLLIGWLWNGGSSPQNAAPAPAAAPPAAAADTAVAQPAPQSTFHPLTARETPQAGTDDTAMDGATASDQSTNWEQSLENILLSSDDDNAKVDHLLALIAVSPPDAQVELAQHLVNLASDDYYAGTAGLLTNSATPGAVSTVLMNDLLNRNNSLKLPMLLAIARNDDHPLKDQAREMLELLIQEDNGTNWDQWSTSINNWLAQNSQ